jgi:hypothetical protein
MQAESARLLEAGVAFTDLTSVFSDHSERIYSDTCCHMLAEGDLIMATAIARHIKQLMAKNRRA